MFTLLLSLNRIDHKSKSKVWIAATHKEVLKSLGKFNLKVLEEGQISGLMEFF